MGENENMEKDVQNIETATEKDKIPDTKIGELDCESLDKVSGGQLIGKKISIANLVTAYGFQDPRDHISMLKYGFTRPGPIRIEPKYGFPNDPSNHLKILKKQLEDELRKPNLSEEERSRIKKRLDVILKQLGGISDGIKQ